MRFILDFPRDLRAFARASQLILFTAVFAASVHANAVIKIAGVNRASNVTGIGTTVVTILGGVAGSTCAGADSDSTTCSNCKFLTGADSTRLAPCNDARINGNLRLQINISSDSQATGYPVITLGAATGQTTTNLPINTNPSAVSKGNVGTIEVPWNLICPKLTVSTGSSGSITSDCDLVGADTATASFIIGMKSVNDGGAFASGDDQATITIKVVKGPTTDFLGTLTNNGITYFEMNSGDGKGTIKKFSCPSNSGFPTGTNVTFKWVRALFLKRADPIIPVWSSINSGSPHVDLEITGTGNCNGGIDVSPVSVTGGDGFVDNGSGTGVATHMNIENDNAYDFKLGVVDEARNAYFYTPDGDSGAIATDTDCELDNGTANPAAIGGSGKYECHTIRPSVVAGVLANKTNCFIATASYGSPMANEVDTFRHFRDTYLIPTKLGLKFVRWYYNEGPKYAAFIRQSDTYRSVARGFLWLPLQFAKISMDYGIVAGLAFLTTTLLAPFALIALMLKRRSRANA